MRALTEMRTVLLDLDGVIYRGEQPLPGASELVTWLDATGRRTLFLSNNSIATREEVTAKLARLGLPRPEGRVLTAGYAAAQRLARRFPGGRVYVLGLPSVERMVADAGLAPVWREGEDGPTPDAVLVALDRSLTYDRLRRALHAVLAGAAFIGVNRDPRLPVEETFDPGTGSLVAALEYASGKPAEIIGKPGPGIVLEALAELDAQPDTTLMVGDALDLDVVAGHAAGVITALVLTGISNAAEAQAATGPRAPDYVFAGLPALLAALQS